MAAFQYEDEVLVCDANDVEGNLQGKCQQMKIDNFEKECPVDKKFLGKFKIPKQEVKGKVDQLRNCGPYYFITNNCQKWLRALLKKNETAGHWVYRWPNSAVHRPGRPDVRWYRLQYLHDPSTL